MRGTIDPTPGRYRQKDLEAMEPETLLAVRDMAVERFNGDLDGPDAEYYELLAGAADEVYLAREVPDAS